MKRNNETHPWRSSIFRHCQVLSCEYFIFFSSLTKYYLMLKQVYFERKKKLFFTVHFVIQTDVAHTKLLFAVTEVKQYKKTRDWTFLVSFKFACHFVTDLIQLKIEQKLKTDRRKTKIENKFITTLSNISFILWF